MGTVSVPSSTLCLTSGVANGDIVFWTERDWSWKSCYGNSIKGVILFLYGAKFQEHCFNISRDVVYSVFYHFFTIFSCKQNDVVTDLICIIEKHQMDISETKKDISKRKTPFFFMLKGLSNKQKKNLMSYAL